MRNQWPLGKSWTTGKNMCQHMLDPEQCVCCKTIPPTDIEILRADRERLLLALKLIRTLAPETSEIWAEADAAIMCSPAPKNN